jgi:hypothetical protein
MPLVEGARVRAMQPPHAVTQVRLRRFDEEMDVVVHEAVGEKPPMTILDRVPQRSEISPAVEVVIEDHPLVVTASKDVEDPSCNLLAQLACHRGESGMKTHSAPETLTPLKGV